MRVYAYPYPRLPPGAPFDPYVERFIAALSPHCAVLNRDRPTSYGLLALLPHLPRLDVLLLNWPEELPDKRWGALQGALLRLLLAAKPVLGFRLVYVLHNRDSHHPGRAARKRAIRRAVLARADLVLTHARAGLEVARAEAPELGERVRFLPLPVPAAAPREPAPPFESRRYDVLVWGTMRRSKGIDALVRLLVERGLTSRYRIVVAGRFPSSADCARLSAAAPGIEFRNRFVPDDELAELMADARLILFAHRPATILASGTLMDSLATDCLLVGPNVGAFRDCAELGLLATFDDLAELPEILAATLAADREPLLRRRRDFAAENRWDRFGAAVADLLRQGDRAATAA